MKAKPSKSCIEGHAGWNYISTPAPEHNRETEPEDVAVHTSLLATIIPIVSYCCVLIFNAPIFGLHSYSTIVNCKYECISKAKMHFLVY